MDTLGGRRCWKSTLSGGAGQSVATSDRLIASQPPAFLVLTIIVLKALVAYPNVKLS
jgi:hypothetical protein